MQEKSNPKLHFFINTASDVLSTLGQKPVIANDPPTYLEITMMASPQLLKASEKKILAQGSLQESLVPFSKVLALKIHPFRRTHVMTPGCTCVKVSSLHLE